MADDTVLRGAGIVRHDDEHRVGTRFLSLFDHTHGVCGVVGAGAGNHRNVDDLLDGPDQLDLLIHMGDGRFAGGAIDHQTIRAIGDEVLASFCAAAKSTLPSDFIGVTIAGRMRPKGAESRRCMSCSLIVFTVLPIVDSYTTYLDCC